MPLGVSKPGVRIRPQHGGCSGGGFFLSPEELPQRCRFGLCLILVDTRVGKLVFASCQFSVKQVVVVVAVVVV